MLKKISITITFICVVCVLPSYTNTCAKPDAAFLKAANLEAACPAVEAATVKSARADNGLEVFPLELISIQL